MLYTIRWPQTSAIMRIFVSIFISKIGWDIAIQNFNFVCCPVPSGFNPGLHKSVHYKTRSRTVSWKFEHNRRSIYRDTAFWSWLGGVVCTPQRGVWTHCHLFFAFSQKSFSRPNEATVELPDCIGRFLVRFGTFCKCFNSRKMTNWFTYYASNCPGSTYGVFPPG